MRLATITNWAYGATVLLTLVSGATMLLASDAHERERAAVAQRHTLQQATSKLGLEIFALTAHAREYVITGDPTSLLVYRREAELLGPVETRVRRLTSAGARPDELAPIKEAIRWADALHDEQATAIDLRRKGDDARARAILFSAEYEREIDRVNRLIEQFQYRLDERTDGDVAAATSLAKIWRTISEIVLAVTGILFLCVLYFVFKQRVLRPVVRLSDVVTRLAGQDYAAEPPELDQIDEIGDMAQAIRIFRENGLERQRLEAERDADMAMRDLLSRMTQRMQGCDTLHDLKEVVQRFVPEIAPTLAGRLYMFDTARNAVVEACSWQAPVHSRPEFAPMACWALRRGMAHRPAGTSIDVPCDHLDVAGGALPDSLCLPLMAQRETVGLLYFEPRAPGEALPAALAPYLQMLAENIGLALANLGLRDTLRALAMVDPLTGLANRRQLDAMLKAQRAEADRSGRPLSCLMLDVDHFKRFNDRFGHDAGDAVLREVGKVLAQATREQGEAFRYGGEEFALLVPGIDSAAAHARAEAIRERIAALRLVHDGQELGPVSVSIGVATTPGHCSADRLLVTADAALLRAKAAGRDRVEIAQGRQDSDAA